MSLDVVKRDKIGQNIPKWKKTVVSRIGRDYIPVMRIIAVSTLQTFWNANPAAEQPMKAWVSVTKAAKWATPHDLKKTFNSVDFVAGRVVFDVGGNKFRIVAGINYPAQIVFIKFVGTHSEYDKIDVANVELKL